MMENFSEIIPLDETAEYLRTKKSTLSKIAREDKIPSVKIEIGEKEIRSKITEVYTHVSRKEIIYNWFKNVAQIIKNNLIMQGNPNDESKLLQYSFPEPLWKRIKVFVRNLRDLSLWGNKELSDTVFGEKQNNEYWQTIFETSKTFQRFNVLPPHPINLMEKIKE